MDTYTSLETRAHYLALPEYEVREPLLPLHKPPQKENRGIELMFHERVESLGEILDDIVGEVGLRKILGKNLQQSVSEHYIEVRVRLRELDPFQFGSNRVVEQRRSQLEKELDSLAIERRREQVQCWKDVADLKREFRTWLKQYNDLKQRLRVVFAKDPL